MHITCQIHLYSLINTLGMSAYSYFLFPQFVFDCVIKKQSLGVYRMVIQGKPIRTISLYYPYLSDYIAFLLLICIQPE